MLDPKSLLGSIDSNSLVGKMLGGMATKNFGAGVLSGGIATALIGKSDVVENAAKLGGMALLGALAYKAYNNYQETKTAGGNVSVVGSVKHAGQGMLGSAQEIIASLMAGPNSSAQAKAGVPAPVQAPQPNPEFTLAVIRAMIGAAKADGHVDSAETEAIFHQMESQGLKPEEKSLLMREMANSPNVTDIAAAANSQEQATQIYLAALLVCDSQCDAEQAYLAQLAHALNLESGFTQALRSELLARRPQQAA